MSAIWVVSVRVDDDDEQVYGPYTELQAKRVAARIQRDADACTDENGGCHHPAGITGAGAWPLARFDGHLTAEQRRDGRRDGREAVRETRAALADWDNR